MSAPTPTGRPPAMTDVAALAGVSHQTVSRVINSVGKVRPETRERVLEAIEELGYRRNETARALATSRSKMIGIIAPAEVNYGPSQMLSGIELAAKEAGYFVSISALDELTEESFDDSINMFFGLGIAGIIVIAPVRQFAKELRNIPPEVPTVVVSSTGDKDQSYLTFVGVDQREGAKSAVRHLIAQGCQTIAHIAGPSTWFDAIEREAGWREALVEAGLPEGPLRRGTWSASSGYELANELISQGTPDAIFASNDQLALGALRALSVAGIDVPKQVKIVGFDNEPGSAYFSVPLTTVRQNFDAVGRSAIKALTTRIKSGESPDLLIKSDLVLRESA